MKYPGAALRLLALQGRPIVHLPLLVLKFARIPFTSHVICERLQTNRADRSIQANGTAHRAST